MRLRYRFAKRDGSPAELIAAGALTRPVLRDLRRPANLDILAEGPKG